MAMPLMHCAARPPRLASTQWLRRFSSCPPQQDNIASLLKTSIANHPAGGQQQQPAVSATLLARDVLNRSAAGEIVESERRNQFQRQMHRKWQPGDVYAPHDLSGQEQKKWKTGRKRPRQDAFDVLGINPILEYKNYTMMSEYMTETGRIKHSKETGLRPKNQRKIAKAIRRAIGLGLMPSVHRHPLVLKKSSPFRFVL